MSEKHTPEPAWSPPSEADLSALSPLGRWLEENRAPLRASAWKKALRLLLAVLAGANFVLRPHEPHFGLDALPLFWPLFGLAAGVFMVFLVKRIIQPCFLKRPEDYYGDL
ncbi:MAG: hypothetical protein LBV70_02615 [Candidatus Adiutrix sp.]|jgi:antibiotic biosynthesis monooxygenase (ABM) superfamily enzyme|nr:hypothetical protein [Candidatus Adiutrix sp.]